VLSGKIDGGQQIDAQKESCDKIFVSRNQNANLNHFPESLGKNVAMWTIG
jgi:hypothetical protein